ncbi:MAG: GLUG motif-containing protein, partial [Rikenellaceae bacterium]
KLSKDVAGGTTYDGVYFEITDDINLMGKQWSSIGSSSHIFKGCVDGGNHTISNITVYTSESHQGLFGYISGAILENINVDGYLYGAGSLGGVVGYARGNSTIRNCHADVNVYGSGDLVGGLAGSISDSVVEGCSSAGKVTCTSTGNYYYGGLIGYASDSDDIDDTEVINCSNSATVVDGTYTGGILGGATDSDQYSHYRGVSIFGCYNTGAITTSKSAAYAGGVAGRFYDSQMLACYNTGEVTSGDHAGGLIGCVHINATTTRMSNFFGCYNTGTISGTISSDALFGYSSISGVNMVMNCYYTSGTQTNDYGEICSDINAQVDLMNNAIAYWNINSGRVYSYIYVTGTTPTLAAGTAELDFDEWSDMAWIAFDGGSGTEGDPYQIANGCQLAKLSNDVAGGESYDGIYFEITDNIDLLSNEWTPIGGSSCQFKGSLDGNSHTISNLKISGSNSRVGLFGYIYGATVSNLTISGGDISGGQYVGGVVGEANEGSTVSHCSVSVTVNSTGDFTGGLVGYLTESVVDYCSAAGTVTGDGDSWYYIGGLIGYACDSDDVADTEVVNSYNTASVNGGTYTGGVLGGAADTDSYDHYRGVSIYGCYNSGTITSSSSHTSYAGGVVGRFYNGQMVACYNNGAVNATGYAGGLNGCVHVNATTSRMSNFFGCYNTGVISGTISSDALFGHSDVSGVSGVLNCYYTSGTQTNGYGESCTDLAVKVAYLNNAIAYWNYNSVRQYGYIYSYSSAPTLVEGVAVFNFDDWSDVAALEFDGGSGTSGDPYQINDGYQLAKLSSDVEGGESYDGIYFEITDNIDLQSKSWSSIGRDGYIFKGIVDGGNNTISNMKVVEVPNPLTAGGGSVGLFGYVEGSTIANITLSGYSVDGTICVGGLLGRADLSFVNNCHVDGALSSTSNYGGGVIGYLVDTSVANCSSAGTVSGASYVGGLVGYAYQRSGVDDIEIFNCSNSATVSDGTYIGGLLGGAADDDVETYTRGIAIYCSYNSGDVITSGSGSKYAGGIAGRFHDGQMVGCYNWGGVTNTCSTGYAGGLIGCVHINSTTKTSGFYGCYSSGAISGTTSSEALFGVTHSLEAVMDCYYTSQTDSSGNGVSVSSITELNENIAYLNNAIAFWNLNSVRYLGYVYTSGSNGPTITTGTPAVYDSNWYYAAASSYAGGSGTESSPYQISNGYQLAKMAVDYESVSPSSSTYFELTNDIDLTLFEWTPIRQGSENLNHIYFDGNNYKISGLTINSDSDHLSLFGRLSYSELQNIRLVDCNITSTSNYIGGLVGALSESLIYNCSVESGTISGSENVGGVVGNVNSCNAIEHCYNSGASVLGSSIVGGVIGYLCYSGSVYACYNEGYVASDSSSSGSDFGGVIGKAYQNDNFIACYNNGAIYAPNSSIIGGVVGYVQGYSSNYTDITSCYNSGVITGKSTTGSIAGSSSYYVSWYCSYYLAGDYYSSSHGVSCSDYSELNGYVSTMNNNITSGSYQTEYEYVAGADPTTQPPTLVEK